MHLPGEPHDAPPRQPPPRRRLAAAGARIQRVADEAGCAGMLPLEPIQLFDSRMSKPSSGSSGVSTEGSSWTTWVCTGIRTCSSCGAPRRSGWCCRPRSTPCRGRRWVVCVALQYISTVNSLFCVYFCFVFAEEPFPVRLADPASSHPGRGAASDLVRDLEPDQVATGGRQSRACVRACMDALACTHKESAHSARTRTARMQPFTYTHTLPARPPALCRNGSNGSVTRISTWSSMMMMVIMTTTTALSAAS